MGEVQTHTQVERLLQSLDRASYPTLDLSRPLCRLLDQQTSSGLESLTYPQDHSVDQGHDIDLLCRRGGLDTDFG